MSRSPSHKKLVGGALSRRAVLRGALGTVVGLPLLECMLNQSGTALAQGTPLPQRWFLFHCPTSLVTSGSRSDGMTPTTTGPGYALTPVLAPLGARGIKDDVTVVSGLFIPPVNAPGGYNVDYHGQSVFAMLTGVRSGFFGTSWRAQGYSPDQLIVNAQGGLTSRPSLYYQLDPVTGGTGLSYEQTQGFSDEDDLVYRAVAPQTSPALAYQQLFSDFVPPDDGEGAAAAALERRLRLSSLSFVKDRLGALQGQVSARDRQTLDQHFTRVRDLETRLLNTVEVPVGARCADPALGTTDPADTGAGVPDQAARAALFAELIEVAFACDFTRVVTLGGTSHMTGPGMRNAPWNHIGGLHGEVQHTSQQSDLDAANAFFVDVYAQVLSRLKAVPEGDGTLLDHTVGTFLMEGGKGLSNDPQRSGDGGGDPNHSCDNAVMLVGGRAGGLVPGRHLSVSGQDLHHATVLNTGLRAVGVTERLGDITGTLDALLEA